VIERVDVRMVDAALVIERILDDWKPGIATDWKNS
jgi:hypothetical protein